MNFNKLKNSTKSKIFRNNYKQWKLEALDESGYFVIFQGFLENGILRKISGNALKLYVFLGINSNNLEGIVWYSNKKISYYFGNSERTIRKWMKELEDLNLIKRMRLKYNGNVYTYLNPYTYKLSIKTNSYTSKIITEGILFIDDINGLYIKSDNLYIPIISSMEIQLWNNENDEWVRGKIEFRRYTEDINSNLKQIKYIFKSYDTGQIIYIKKDKCLKVRALIV